MIYLSAGRTVTTWVFPLQMMTGDIKAWSAARAQSRPLKHTGSGELGRGLDLQYEGEVDERESGG